MSNTNTAIQELQTSAKLSAVETQRAMDNGDFDKALDVSRRATALLETARLIAELDADRSPATFAKAWAVWEQLKKIWRNPRGRRIVQDTLISLVAESVEELQDANA